MILFWLFKGYKGTPLRFVMLLKLQGLAKTRLLDASVCYYHPT